MEVPQRLRASKNWIGGGGRQGFVLPFLEGERELGIGGVPVRENVANAIKCQICNGESTKLWHCPWLRNGPISYRYEITVLMETGLPDPC